MDFLRRLFGQPAEPPKPRPSERKHAYGYQAAAEGFEFGSESVLKHDAFTGDSRDVNAPSGPLPAILSEEQAIQRYRYLLQSAPPATLAQGHAEAFVRMPQAQRARILRELAAARPADPSGTFHPLQDDPRSLAEIVTEVEREAPGTLEHALGGPAAGLGGGMLAGTLFASIAVGFIESDAARQFFDSLTREATIAASETPTQVTLTENSINR